MARNTPNFSAYIPPETKARFVRARDARGLTSAQYLEKLLDLHDAARAFAEMKSGMGGSYSPNQAFKFVGEMERLGLVSVTA